MYIVGEFQKISPGQFKKDMTEALGGIYTDKEIEEIYRGIELPARATTGSAGYDFKIPFNLSIRPGESVKVPTGIRVQIDEGWMLALFPRSSMGFKYAMRLNNTVGIIDSDYYMAENEGHILCKIRNESVCGDEPGRSLELEQGRAFVQGVFLPFGLAAGDSGAGERRGGFGSTDSEFYGR